MKMYWTQNTVNSAAVEKFLERQFNKRLGTSTSRQTPASPRKTTNKRNRATTVIPTPSLKGKGRDKNRSVPQKMQQKKTQGKKGETLLEKKTRTKKTQVTKKKTQTKV